MRIAFAKARDTDYFFLHKRISVLMMFLIDYVYLEGLNYL